MDGLISEHFPQLNFLPSQYCLRATFSTNVCYQTCCTICRRITHTVRSIIRHHTVFKQRTGTATCRSVTYLREVNILVIVSQFHRPQIEPFPSEPLPPDYTEQCSNHDDEPYRSHSDPSNSRHVKVVSIKITARVAARVFRVCKFEGVVF